MLDVDAVFTFDVVSKYFQTSDSTLPHGTAMSDKVLMTGFPHEFSSERVLNVLPEDHQKHINNVRVL